MCGTFEWDENVKLIIKLNFWEGWIFGTVEWDYTVESDKTVEFVKLLNMLGLLKEIWTLN